MATTFKITNIEDNGVVAVTFSDGLSKRIQGLNVADKVALNTEISDWFVTREAGRADSVVEVDSKIVKDKATALSATVVEPVIEEPLIVTKEL